MNTYIVLLRGINVGGHKKVPMAELRQLLNDAGFDAVKTYIQTGNIILQSTEDKNVVEQQVQDAIQSHFGFQVPTIAKTNEDLQRQFRACPFPEDKKKESYFVILSHAPRKALVDNVMEISYDNEEFHIVDDCLYFHSSAGYGKSKFNMNLFEKRLNVKATSRNYKTMLKLIAMSSENGKEH